MPQQGQRWGMERGCPLSPSEFLRSWVQIKQAYAMKRNNKFAALKPDTTFYIDVFSCCIFSALDAASNLHLEDGWKTHQCFKWVCTGRTPMASHNAARASHNADAKELSDSNPCRTAEDNWDLQGKGDLSWIETTEKMRNQVEKRNGCYHLKVVIVKPARCDFPSKREYVQDGIQVHTCA